MAGNSNSGRRTGDGRWADAVRLAAMREIKGDQERRRYIDKIAMQLVETAAEGDIAAIREVGDRLDGKPKQSIDQKVDGGDTLQALWQAIANKSHVGQKDD